MAKKVAINQGEVRRAGGFTYWIGAKGRRADVLRDGPEGNAPAVDDEDLEHVGRVVNERRHDYPDYYLEGHCGLFYSNPRIEKSGRSRTWY